MEIMTICEQELWTAFLCIVESRCSDKRTLQMLARKRFA